MKFYIDTNTFPTNPALYADAEKSKRIPQILPVVQLTRGAVQIGFLGENTPPDGALVEFSATIAGTNTQVVLARGEKTANGDAWEFNLNFNSEALSIALESKHADVMLIAGIIVSTEAFRQEWQFRLSASETATGELDPKQVESAKDFADVAERSATRAEGAAQYAELSSRDASESAEAAQASAEAAGKSQASAAQSAKEALQSKTDAVSAKNAAETAKADAENAKTGAESAKTAAEKAASDAQATLANVYTKSEIDGVATGAEVTLKMNEIIAQLKDYEEVTGEKLLLDFWQAVMEEFQRWQMNPTEVKVWATTSATESTSPYFSSPPTKPVVDFSVSRCYGTYSSSGSLSAFNKETSVCVYLPSATFVGRILSGVQHSPILIAPKAVDAQAAFSNSKYNSIVFLGASECSALLANTREFASYAVLRGARSCANAFLNTAMSAENISKTLDSLPAWTDGASHVITFTGSPGASELTQDSPSVAAAVARGWTVEL